MKKIVFLLFAALLSLTAVAQDNEVVTPPTGLQTESWMLTAQRYDASEYTVDAFLSLHVGFDGQDVYVQGLNMYLPETWVKGTRNGNQLTFKTNQYYGDMSDSDGTGYDTYFAGCDASWFDGVSGLQPIDVTFTINPAVVGNGFAVVCGHHRRTAYFTLAETQKRHDDIAVGVVHVKVQLVQNGIHFADDVSVHAGAGLAEHDSIPEFFKGVVFVFPLGIDPLERSG